MARLGLDENQKFKKLALALNSFCGGMGKQLALGLLETLWNAAYERADDFLGDSDDVEIAADWKGERGALTRMLAHVPAGKAAGLIEADDERGGYIIHDFEVHAPAWVKLKMTKAAAREAEGRSISDIRREASRKGVAARAAIKRNQTVQLLVTSDNQTDEKNEPKSHNGTERNGTERAGTDTPPARGRAGDPPAPTPVAPAPEAPPSVAPPLAISGLMVGGSSALAAGGEPEAPPRAPLVSQPAPVSLPRPPIAPWRIGIEGRWSKLAGVPGFSFPGILDLAKLVDAAALETDRDPGELFDDAVKAFKAWREECSPGRAPQLVPLKLVEHWATVWERLTMTAPPGKVDTPRPGAIIGPMGPTVRHVAGRVPRKEWTPA